MTMEGDSTTSQLELIGVLLNPSEIVKFKFIIESYEHLAEIRTLNSEKGKLLVMATRDTAEDLYKIIESIEKSLNLTLVKKDKLPQFLKGEKEDWLVNSLANSLAKSTAKE